jgi:thiol-disulfide isomerase/thioredoxin
MTVGWRVLYCCVTAGAIVAVGVLVLAAAGGGLWRWRDGRLKGARQRSLTVADLGQPLGAKATLLQFSSSFCAPCRAARVLLADVAGGTEGVSHVEINVADRLDLVRLLDVRRTPTLFVLGPRGQITRRASGVPRRDEVAAAVALAAGEPAPGQGSIGSDSRHGLA